ncbi:hypothetical protein MLD38_029375 [Melastoma candidum]|uniref:Uncharacterized protein n=1 Tax=Melastoma candidum TaxID=119954 RepID=A0ACB9N9A7_9MYRT|nr:hypothetical protein MLD38_029375 [Melastoma candidum]
MERKKYPIGAEHYALYEEVGQGVSASVHRALCIPLDEIVAIKILDFERYNSDLNNIFREAQTMVLVDHPNVLKSHCSFVSDHNLWVVMPFMAGGSCLHILKAAYPDGLEEAIIATVLRDILKGLEYLHQHGHIHRDVKAGNILIGSRGSIKLGDFGVSACLFDSGDRQRTRNTFVGTPCWMAPEVMEQLHGYDFKADIWSFGITALELAHGHAPFSKYPPMKVLLMTLQSAPPGLDYERDRKFSKSFKQMIASCLVKDPTKRPSAKKLLKHSFFKQARSSDYIARTLLEGLPALGDRMQALKRKEEDMLAQKKMPDGQKEEISQNEYKRGISGWNFDLEDMKAQASLIQDVEDSASDSNYDGSLTTVSSAEGMYKPSESPLLSMNQLREVSQLEENGVLQNQADPCLFAVSPDVAICEKSDEDRGVAVSTTMARDRNMQNNPSGKPEVELLGKSIEGIGAISYKRRGGSLGNNIPDLANGIGRIESEKSLSYLQAAANGNILAANMTDDVVSDLPPRAFKSSASGEELDDIGKLPVVQQRGRFKVTSESVDFDKVVPSPILQKSHSMQVGRFEVINQSSATSSSPLPSPTDALTSTHSSHALLSMWHSVLLTNIIQREQILSSMRQVTAGEFAAGSRGNESLVAQAFSSLNEKSTLEAAHDREKELLHEITELQWKLIRTQEELQKLKLEHPQV